jgi:arylsulfatase A-like enzyme
MSGYYPSATRTYGYVSGRKNIGPERKTWSQVFKDNGYYTARVSKIFHMGVPIDIENGSDGQDDPTSWGNVMTIVKAEGDDTVHSDGKTAEKTCELIRLHKDEPFFIAAGFVRPHVPFVAPKEYFEPYPFHQIALPQKYPGDWDDIPQRGINYVTSVNGQMNTEQEQKAVAAYYASVAYMDKQVGKILTTLEEEGLENNTIVIFTSDHGFHLGEHSFWMKVSLHEESVRVPLIIKVPGKEPAVTNSFAELIDLYPTIAELAGIEVSEHLQGESLVEVLDNPNKSVRDMTFSVSQGGRTFLLRTEEWAFIQYEEDASAGMELYDMHNDPEQFINLAHKEEYELVVNDFKQKLKEKLQDVRTNDLQIDYAAKK